MTLGRRLQPSGSLDVRITLARAGFDLTVDFIVEPGRVLALMGPNGSGKSTTLSCIVGFREFEGHVSMGGRRLDELPINERRGGIVFQDYLLFPHLTVEQNIAFGPRARGQRKGEAATLVEELLRRFGLTEVRNRRPSQISGGQAQRVALARALAVNPEFLLLDEPLAALDSAVRDDVRRDLALHLQAFDGPAVLVTHNVDDVRALASDVIVLESGNVTYGGTVGGLATAGHTPYLRRLIKELASD